ncbi:MAG: acylneuraminate cytidylyltransferase family protein [Aminobacterium sp.]|jgi:CMP-N,N'-diacetyllegionaminic acid synthase
MNCVAVIPARGGSKGVHRKNMRMLNGRPLVGWTIDAALKSKYITHCVLSTDDDEIAEYGRSWGIDIVVRPSYLAEDTTPTAPVVSHVIESLGTDYQGNYEIVLLQPTSPLRTFRQIDECISETRARRMECAVSLTETDHTPYKTLVEEKGKLLPLMGQEYFEMPRQKLPKTWRINGAIYYVNVALFLKTRKFVNFPFYPYIMGETSSIDIDNEFDLAYAEFLFSQLGKTDD